MNDQKQNLPVESRTSGLSEGSRIFALRPGEAGEDDGLLFWALDRMPLEGEPYEVIETYCVDRDCRCNQIRLNVVDRAAEGRSLGCLLFEPPVGDQAGILRIDEETCVSDQLRWLVPELCELLETEQAWVDRLIDTHYAIRRACAQQPSFDLRSV